MGNHNQVLGKKGENYVAEALKKNGYRIVGRNVRTKFGELDLIAGNKLVLMFIEVKTRQSLRFGQGDEAVHYYKTKHLKRNIESYLASHPTNREVRLVAATVYFPPQNSLSGSQSDFSTSASGHIESPAIKFLRVL